jgi:uncharacterized membrane protein
VVTVGDVLILMAIALMTTFVLMQGGRLMALSDDVKAFRDEVSPKLDALVALATEAAADIREIHDLLSGSDPDVPGALAALEELRGKFASVETAAADLKAAVDIPEPGDTPPPPAEG